jgi:PAS domain S-box-containing protein
MHKVIKKILIIVLGALSVGLVLAGVRYAESNGLHTALVFMIGVLIVALTLDIMQRKDIERKWRSTRSALSASRACYRVLADNGGDLICRFQPNGTITFVNDNYCNYFGRTRKELVGKSFLIHFPAQEQKTFHRHIASFTPEQNVIPYELSTWMPSGSIRFQRWKDQAIFDHHGKLIEIQSVGRDVTSNRQAEIELRRTEIHNQVLIEATTSIVWTCSAEGKFVSRQLSWESYTGQGWAEHMGYGWMKMIHRQDHRPLLETMRQLREHDKSFDVEWRLWHADTRQYRFVECRGSPIADESGTVIEWGGAIHAIDDRRRVEQRLKTYGRVLGKLATSRALEQGDFDEFVGKLTETDAHTLGVQRVSVWLFNQNSSLLYCIDRYDVSQDEHTIDFELHYFVYPSYFGWLIEGRHLIAADDAYKQPQIYELSEMYLSPNGIFSVLHVPIIMERKVVGVIWHDQVIQGRRWSDDEQDFARSIADFVSLALASKERRRAQEKESDFARLLEDSLNEIYVFAAATLKFIHVNKGAQENLGFSMEELRLLTPLDLAPEFTLRSFEVLVRPLRKGEKDRIQFTTTLRRKNGSSYPVEIHLQFSSYESNPVFIALALDITRRRRLEEITRQQELKLIQANKMAALGTLVSGVAHEINNPNNVVMMNARLLVEAWEDVTHGLDAYCQEHRDFQLGGLPYEEMRSMIPTLLEDVYDSSARIAKIVSNLKDFARPKENAIQAEADLNDAIRSTLPILKHLVKTKTNHFILHLAPDLPPLAGDPHKLGQVFINLVMNALEALPNKNCRVEVTTRLNEMDRYVELIVDDEGVGIVPEDKERIFDPYFTTKQQSGGTGLGLAISYSIIKEHGGTLAIDSSRASGTVARVLLPIGNQKASLSEPGKPSALGAPLN